MKRITNLTDEQFEQTVIGQPEATIKDYDWLDFYPIVDNGRITGRVETGDGANFPGLKFDEDAEVYRPVVVNK